MAEPYGKITIDPRPFKVGNTWHVSVIWPMGAIAAYSLWEKVMPDTAVQGSVEEIAYRLFQHVAFAEKKGIAAGYKGESPDREWILKAYTDCLFAVRRPSGRGEGRLTPYGKGA
jgi:hypothetical protein